MDGMTVYGTGSMYMDPMMSTMRGGRPSPFEKADTDKSGGIDQAELTRVFEDISEKSGVSFTAEEIAQRFDEFDEDGSGSLNEEEMRQGMIGMQEVLGMPPMPERPSMESGLASYLSQMSDEDKSALAGYVNSASADETDDGAIAEMKKLLDDFLTKFEQTYTSSVNVTV